MSLIRVMCPCKPPIVVVQCCGDIFPFEDIRDLDYWTRDKKKQHLGLLASNEMSTTVQRATIVKRFGETVQNVLKAAILAGIVE